MTGLPGLGGVTPDCMKEIIDVEIGFWILSIFTANAKTRMRSDLECTAIQTDSSLTDRRSVRDGFGKEKVVLPMLLYGSRRLIDAANNVHVKFG